MIDVMNGNGTLGHAAGSLVSGGVFTITSVPSLKVRADGKGIYRGPLQYTFSGGNASGFDSGSVATTVPQAIQPTAIKARADGLAVIRLGDSGQMAAIGTVSGTPTAIIGLVKISDAGQGVVRAN